MIKFLEKGIVKKQRIKFKSFKQLKLHKSLLKSKNFSIRDKKVTDVLKKKLVSFSRQHKKIKGRIKSTYAEKNSLKKKRNLIQFSYFSRFLLKRKQARRFFFLKNNDYGHEIKC